MKNSNYNVRVEDLLKDLELALDGCFDVSLFCVGGNLYVRFANGQNFGIYCKELPEK